MAEDADEPVVDLEVVGGDVVALRAALEEEGISVREVSEQEAAGFGLLAWLVKLVLDGSAWDMATFVTKRGSKGIKKLVKHLQEKSGKADEKGTVVMQDAEAKTTVYFESDLPDAAYEALKTVDWNKLAGLTLNWRDGKWQVELPRKIKLGDDGF
jgi:hypothetical protein